MKERKEYRRGSWESGSSSVSSCSSNQPRPFEFRNCFAPNADEPAKRLSSPHTQGWRIDNMLIGMKEKLIDWGEGFVLKKEKEPSLDWKGSAEAICPELTSAFCS
jgi:hypothetical protein